MSTPMLAMDPAASVVGYFRTGRSTLNRPEALESWRVTTRDAHISLAVGELFGGQPAACKDDEAGGWEVLTESTVVRVVLDSPDALRFSMRRWARTGLVHHCDGMAHLSPAEVRGTACGCPATLEERRALARAGRGPQPSTTVTFHLPDRPTLGKFQFRSNSWKLAEDVPRLRMAFSSSEGPVYGCLRLDIVSCTTANGAELTYCKPGVDLMPAAALPLPAAA